MDDEVVIRTYDAPHEAELTAAYLREHGVTARVDNDVLTGMNPLWSVALGGIRVHVPHADAARAHELLTELDQASPDSELVPQSEARRSEADRTARRALAAAAIGTFILPVLSHVYSLWIAWPLEREALSRRGRRDRRAAVAIDLVVLGLVGLVLMGRIG